jgi:hypothetical protein
MKIINVFLVALLAVTCYQISFGQDQPHITAHSHNDYQQKRPLTTAIQNRFNSVEADVYLVKGKLLVSHDYPVRGTAPLEQLYLSPLNNILQANSGYVYRGYKNCFYLMIDCKSEATSTYRAIRAALSEFPNLLCSSDSCSVKIFLSGNRPLDLLSKEGYAGIAIDGRPNDLGKGYSTDLMPVISDQFKNWSSWNGKSADYSDRMERIRDLAKRVHSEGKKLRLWAIPDNELAWGILLESGVDIINTDHLPELDQYLTSHGL